MIQRVQTLYLLIAISTIALFLTAPAIRYESQDGIVNFNVPAWDVVVFISGYYVYFTLIFAAIASALSIIAVFLFKYRKVQLLITRIAMLPVLLSGLTVLYVFLTKETSLDMIYYYGNILVLLPLAFLFLAQKAIKKDEDLIRSLDRVR
jgi:hypothetical protein